MSGGEFAAIEARVAAATEGPWRVWSGTRPYDDEAAVETAWAYEGEEEVELVTDCCSIADAEFIAHARGDVPALLAAVRERDNTIARIREVLDDYDGLNAEPIPKLSTHTWMHEVRAALEPQEKR